MEVIGVLSDEELELAELLKLDESQVGGVGLHLVWRNPPLRRWQAGVTSRPHPARTAKVRDAGVGADASAREGDNVLALNDSASDGLDVLLEALFLGHDAPPQGTHRSDVGVSGNRARAHAALAPLYATKEAALCDEQLTL